MDKESAPLTYPGPRCILCGVPLDEEDEAVNFCFECENAMLQQILKEEMQ